MIFMAKRISKIPKAKDKISEENLAKRKAPIIVPIMQSGTKDLNIFLSNDWRSV